MRADDIAMHHRDGGYIVPIAEGVSVRVAKLIARPTLPLSNPDFKYVKANDTKIGERFERMKREQEQTQPPPANVKPIRKGVK